MFGKKQKNPENNIELHGEISHRFLVPEFLDYERGPVWYLVAGLISLLVIAVGILLQAISFVIAYLLFLAVYFLMHQREARIIEVQITQHGIVVDGDFITFGSIKNFWLIWNPPYTADLKLHVDRIAHPIVTIHAFGQDPAALRGLFADKITEAADRKESLPDILSRGLRL